MLGEHDGELVAAQPADDVVGRDDSVRSAATCLRSSSPALMAATVVDALQDRERRRRARAVVAVALGAFELALGDVCEPAAVEDPGKGIGHRVGLDGRDLTGPSPGVPARARQAAAPAAVANDEGHADGQPHPPRDDSDDVLDHRRERRCADGNHRWAGWPVDGTGSGARSRSGRRTGATRRGGPAAPRRRYRPRRQGCGQPILGGGAASRWTFALQFTGLVCRRKSTLRAPASP